MDEMPVSILAPPAGDPGLSVDPGMIDFGLVLVDSAADAQVVTLTNHAEEDVVISEIGEVADPFTLDSADCGSPPFTLVPGGSCQLTVGFGPVVSGPYADTIAIEVDEESDPLEVSLSGIGVLPEIFDDRFEALGMPGMPLRVLAGSGRP